LAGTVTVEGDAEREFLATDYGDVALKDAVSNVALLPVLEARYSEAIACLYNNLPLAAVIFCGSILEGLLLDLGYANPEQFNRAPHSPKDSNRRGKLLHDWTLADLIDVAYDIGALTVDVQRFSHALRDFRNYIHPYQQWKSGFNPDIHTARVCLQVLKAAIACLATKKAPL
jgi:hypothetical protein